MRPVKTISAINILFFIGLIFNGTVLCQEPQGDLAGLKEPPLESSKNSTLNEKTFPFAASLDEGLWSIGFVVPFWTWFQVKKQGTRTQADFYNGSGIVIENFKTYEFGTPKPTKWMSTFSTGIWEYVGETFEADGPFETKVGKVREYSILYGFSWVWEKWDRGWTYYRFFLGPTLEYNRFDVHAYLADNSDRNSPCGRALFRSDQSAMKRECEQVVKTYYKTSPGFQFGFIQQFVPGKMTFYGAMQSNVGISDTDLSVNRYAKYYLAVALGF